MGVHSPDASGSSQLTVDLAQLKDFRFLILSVHAQALEPIGLPPYAGSTFRGAFGRALKRAVCVMEDQDCAVCAAREGCPYEYVFNTPVPVSTRRMRKYTAVPHPFLLDTGWVEEQELDAGAEFSFDLTLIGEACAYLSYFVHSFELLGRRFGLGRGRGKFRVTAVCNKETGGGETVLYAPPAVSFLPRNIQLQDGYSLAQGATAVGRKARILRVQFLTPCRLVANDRLAGTPTFRTLISSLLRRLSNLSYFHCGVELDLPFKELLGVAEQVKLVDCQVRWHDWERYSARQQTKMRLGGLLGSAVYSCDFGFGLFLPLLKLGEVVHVGKGTSFGLGKLSVEAGL